MFFTGQFFLFVVQIGMDGIAPWDGGREALGPNKLKSLLNITGVFLKIGHII